MNDAKHNTGSCGATMIWWSASHHVTKACDCEGRVCDSSVTSL